MNKPNIKSFRLKVFLESILILIMFASISYLLINFYYDYKSEQKLRNLQESVKASRYQSSELTTIRSVEHTSNLVENKASDEETNQSELSQDDSRNNEPILDIYKDLHDFNENFSGWLYVEDTGIEYPVMQGPDNKFYLSHDMNKVYDKYGMLIMDVNCNNKYDSPHFIIYGHNVNSGKLFGELLFYKEEAYYNYHPIINFDTLYECGKYKIYAAILTNVNIAQGDSNIFTTFNFETEEDYNKLINWAKSNSLYNIEYTPNYGDELLTLVTCEHSNEAGRFIVMAGKIKE